MILRTAFILFLTVILTGCFLFPKKPTVQQGIILTEQQMKSVHVGMDEMQVIELLGSPLFSDIFDSHQRWTYAYSLQRDGKPLVKQKLILEFNQNRVVRISR